MAFLANQDDANEFVSTLGCKERQVLYQALTKLEIDTPMATAEMGIDCPHPLHKEETHSHGSDAPPSWSQLSRTFTREALPFVGFGFLDNLIMIVAGDYIDTTLGVTLGISTMAAAGLGNALSDVAGIGSAWWVEWAAHRVGIRPPSLSLAQSEMRSTRWTIHSGRALGVLFGCILGMFPLFFMKDRSESKKEDKSKDIKEDSNKL